MIILNLKERDRYYRMPAYHFHSTYEVFIVTDGECKFFIYDNLYTLKSGDAMLLKPDVFHYCSAVTEHTRIVLEFGMEDLREYFRSSLIEELLMPFETQLVTLNSDAVDMCKKAACAEDGLTCLSMAEILRSLASAYKKSGFAKAAVTGQKPHKMQKMNDAALYISRNYKTIESLEEICDACYINKSYLCRLFKSTFAISVWEHISNLKIRHACELLASTRLSVYDIAIDSGFNSSQYFSRIFKTHIGCTPLEYRKRYTGQRYTG